MNTISILQDEAHNMPEGLYLRLMDALKKDFDIKEESGDDIPFDTRVKLMFLGYMDSVEDCDLTFQANSALSYLSDTMGADDELVKELFDDFFEQEECYFDIDKGKIIFADDEYDDEERDEMDCIKYLCDMKVYSEEKEYANDLFNNRSEFIYLFMVFQLNKYEELLEKHLHYWIFDRYENNRPFFYSSLINYP